MEKLLITFHSKLASESITRAHGEQSSNTYKQNENSDEAHRNTPR